MGALLLAVLLSATPPKASDASRLAHAGKWDDLYLAFAAAKPAGYSAPDRAQVARALGAGCVALEGKDAVMAYSLGDRSTAFLPTEDGLLCLVRAARQCDQRGAAEKALRAGLVRFPKDGRFGLELGRQLLEDHDPAGARAALEKVPRSSKEAPQARRLVGEAKREQTQAAQARQETHALEVAIARGHAPAEAPRTVTPASGTVDTLSYQSSVGEDGMRTRANRHFILKYFNDNRDFGQRADYEGHLVDAMETAHRFAKEVLGQARDTPCSVILYTRAEFTTHFGPGAALRIAGLYKENAIRVNDAAELNPETRATLVHEYVHAVVDEIAGFHAQRIPVWMNEGLAEYVEWRFKGRDEPVPWVKADLRSQARGHQTPKLTALSQGPLIAGANPQLLYAQSAVAIRLLLSQAGAPALLQLFQEVGGGAPFPAAFEKAYGRPLSAFQEDLESELSRK